MKTGRVSLRCQERIILMPIAFGKTIGVPPPVSQPPFFSKGHRLLIFGKIESKIISLSAKGLGIHGGSQVWEWRIPTGSPIHRQNTALLSGIPMDFDQGLPS